MKRTKRKAGARRRAAPDAPLRPVNIEHTQATRELFWNNVIREILTSISTLTIMNDTDAERPDAEPDSGPPAAPRETDDARRNLLDGRLGLITAQGQRIPIAAVYPLFACGVPGTDALRALSLDVECSVFQVHTPHGEVYTLPLHEVRGFHAVQEEAMEQVKAAARAANPEEFEQPFGFAAFTSLARRAQQPAQDAGPSGGTAP